METLKVRRNKLIYVVPIPKRFKHLNKDPSTIKIRFVCGEFHYVPRYKTFGRFRIFTSDELQAIVDELNILNKKEK